MLSFPSVRAARQARPPLAIAGLRLTRQDEGLNIPRPTHKYAGFAWPIPSSRSITSTIQAFTWRGTRLSVTRWDGAGRLQPPLAAIDVGSGDQYQRLTAALSPDQGTLVVGDGFGNVGFFDARTGRLFAPVVPAHGSFSSVEAVAFSSDGTTMVSIGLGEGTTAQPDPRRSLIVWDVRTHRPRAPRSLDTRRSSPPWRWTGRVAERSPAAGPKSSSGTSGQGGCCTA